MNEEFGYSVLVVEDEAVNRLTLERMLTKKGCLVSCVENGQEAVVALESTSYDCVLMDVRMPVMDGIQATKKIRSLDRRSRNVPVIALTAYAMPGDREKCLDAGMDDYLAKPVDVQCLLDCLERHLGGAPDPGSNIGSTLWNAGADHGA